MSVETSTSEATTELGLPGSRRYVRVRVGGVVDETSRARSLVLKVPPEHALAFGYEAGQFLTVRATIGDTQRIRCYSISSAPATDDEIRITVKRHTDGVMSTWLTGEVAVGDELEVLPPSGDFILRAGSNDIVAFASGSGITPVLGLVKTILVTTDRKFRLFYANQDRDSVIFAGELASLAAMYRHRFSVVHHLYDEQGYVAPEDVTDFLLGHCDPDVFVCGSTRFAATVLSTLAQSEHVRPDRTFVESFRPGDESVIPDQPSPDGWAGFPVTVTEEVVLKLRGRRHTLPYAPGETLLETARRAGLSPPFSCEAGTCASCMALLKRGTVTMAFNSVLTPEEIGEGWRLTCQGYPASPSVWIEYPD
jgi:ferredoxin-NADP reductase